MEERRIVELLWARDEAALRAAEDCCGPLCRGLARNLLGSPEDAEECWSDALLRAWNAIPPERPLHFRAYLAKLTRGLAVDRLRERSAEKRGGGAAPALLDELAECIPGGESAEEALDARELGAAVSAFVRDLPARERTLFVRRYFHGEALGEIAKRLGMKENSAAVALRRVREQLRARLTKEGYLP